MPTTYRGNTCTYKRATLLAGYGSHRFDYDASGLRTKKNDTVYTYIGGKLIREENSGHTIDYIYGNDGITGIKYNGTVYIFRKNVFGDVTHIYDMNGVLNAHYIYDAWGNHTVVNDTETEIGTINPIRYRSYYYDTETNLYYLRARYYDPETGKFISQDNVSYLDPENLTGLNLYAYCNDNPVMHTDSSGNSILVSLLIAVAIGAVTGFAFDVGKQLIKNDWNFSEVDWGSATNSAIVGGALGFSLAMGVIYLGPVIAGTAIAGGLTASGAFAISTAVSFGAGTLGYALEEWIDGRTPSVGKAIANGAFVALEGMLNFGVGAIIGCFGNVGTKGKFLVSTEWWGKFIFGLEFTQPIKIGIDLIRKSI